MKLGLPGMVAHMNLSFRRFKDQRKKKFNDACSLPTQPTWEMSVFRTETKPGLGLAHHTYNCMTAECRAGWTVRSQIRDWPRLTHRYPLAINNIKTEINKSEPGGHVLVSAARTLKLGLYIGAQKGLSANIKLGLPGTVAHRNLSFRRFEDQRKKNFEDACS